MAPKGGICRRYVQCTDSRFGALESELPSATQGRGKQHERVRVPMADLQKKYDASVAAEFKGCFLWRYWRIILVLLPEACLCRLSFHLLTNKQVKVYAKRSVLSALSC